MKGEKGEAQTVLGDEDDEDVEAAVAVAVIPPSTGRGKGRGKGEEGPVVCVWVGIEAKGLGFCVNTNMFVRGHVRLGLVLRDLHLLALALLHIQTRVWGDV